MATYKSQTVSLAQPAEAVYEKFTNLENLGELLKRVPANQVPDDKAALLEQVKVTKDTISFPGGPAGEVTLKLAECVPPTTVSMVGVGTPVPLSMTLNIVPLSADTCETYVQIDIQIPAMLKPMVNGPLQKMADQFAQMLRQIPID